jgi:hypothetical protein
VTACVFGTLEIDCDEPLALRDFTLDFGEAEGGEVVATFEDDAVTLHVLGRREIPDGGLTCVVDGHRRGRVTLDARLILRLAAEAQAWADRARD